MNTLTSLELLNIKITSDSKDSILKYILEALEKSDKKPFHEKIRLKIFTPNPEILMYARSHPEFKRLLNEADINLPDGVGLLLASKLLGLSLKTRITGVDLMECICKVLSEENIRRIQNDKKPYSVGFFGGRGNVAEKTAHCLQKKYSGLQISYADEVWDEAKMKSKRIDVLFVAMGFPLQESWITEHLEKIPVNVAMGVGGSFDFLSGNVPRAPRFLRTIGLEWLFRLIIQPWRIKRQLQLVSFGLLVLSKFFQVRILGKKSK